MVLLLLLLTQSPFFFLPCSALSPRRLTPWDQSLSLLAWGEITKLDSRGWGGWGWETASTRYQKVSADFRRILEAETSRITEEREAER